MKNSKAIIADIKQRGYILINNVFHPPGSPEAIAYLQNKPRAQPRTKRNKTAWIDDTLNIKNKANIIDAFIRYCALLSIDVWPEFYFDLITVYRFDYAIPVHNGMPVKVAIEVQGGIWSKGNSGHSSGTGIQRDMNKTTSANLLGWTLIQVTPDQLFDSSTFDRLRSALTLKLK